ncbi:hypothetical protein DFAR_1860035 [Desulfarculales bacterium]
MTEDSQAAMFAEVHQAFSRWGLLRRNLRLNHHNRTSSVRCDDVCFSRYLVKDKPCLPPELSGWVSAGSPRKNASAWTRTNASAFYPRPRSS